MKLRSIPAVPKGNDPREQFDQAIKENLETITGRRVTPIASLNANTATLSDVVAKINEILTRIQ